MDEQTNDDLQQEDSEELTQETEQNEEQDNEEQSEEQETSEEVDWETKAKDLEKQLQSKDKQQRDQQSFLQHQINELKGDKSEVATKEEPKSELSDEDINELYFENPAEAMRLMMAKSAPQNQQSKLEVQEEIMRGMNDDYDEVIEIVKQAIGINPELNREIMSAANPAMIGYKKGLEMRKSQQMLADPEAYEKQLREKIEREYAQEGKTKIPPRLGGSRSSVKPSKNAESEEEQGALSLLLSRRDQRYR